MKITNNLLLVRENGIFIPKEMKVGRKERFSLSENEKMEAVFIVFGGQLDVDVYLVGNGASCDLRCLYLTSDENETNISLKVLHEHKKTVSNQIIRGVLTDQSRAIFNGVIKMKRDSQQCVGSQNHRAVLLSQNASVQATPELEIYADDVQCSHGSAVGPLEKEALFYLMARGIEEKEAEKILIRAFVCDLIPEDYHFVVDEWLVQHV